MADAPVKEAVAPNYKGCGDGEHCPQRNRCERFVHRKLCADTVMFWRIYAPTCQFHRPYTKKVTK